MLTIYLSLIIPIKLHFTDHGDVIFLTLYRDLYKIICPCILDFFRVLNKALFYLYSL